MIRSRNKILRINVEFFDIILEKGSRTRLSLAQKIQLIEQSSKPGFKKERNFWLEKFGIGRTTLHNILKEKEQILSLASSGFDIQSKSRSMAKMAKNNLLPPPPPHLMDEPDQKPPPFLQYFPYK